MGIKVVKEYNSANEFEFWGPAERIAKELTKEQMEALWETMESYFSGSLEEVTDVTINDVFSYGADELFESTFGVGYEVFTTFECKTTNFEDTANELKKKVFTDLIAYFTKEEEPTSNEVLNVIKESLSNNTNVIEDFLFKKNEDNTYTMDLYVEFGEHYTIAFDCFEAEKSDLIDLLDFELE